jgi:glyoxylase-like metal-dependent hydrolase (beta-lactamase superfamily II)
VSPSGAREVLAVRYGHRVTTRAESYLNFHLYGEPDADLDIDYFFWVIREPDGDVILVDTGFAPEAGDRRRREHHTTPAQALPSLGMRLDDVTTIVITHGHWDHTGNIGQFPRAHLVLTEAEYDFWTGPLAARTQFAAHSEPDEIAQLERARGQDRLTLFSGQYALAPGIDLIEVGGHTPGQLIVSVATDGGPVPGGPVPGGPVAGGTVPANTVILASDAVHFYDETERDRPFAIVADLPAMYRAYDMITQLAAQPATHIVAGHDPLVQARFAAHPTSPDATDLTSPANPRQP